MVYNAATVMEMVTDTSAVFPAGWWFDIAPHLPILYTIARHSTCPQNGEPAAQRPVRALEIGVRQGPSTLTLLAGIRDAQLGGKLISLDIDPIETAVAQSLVHKAGLSDYWEFHLADSNDWAPSCPGDLDLLWIDGDHHHPQPSRDVANYGLHLRQGGLLLMHDYFVEEHRADADGVKRAVEEMKATGQYEICTIPWTYGLTIARKLWV